MKSNLILLSILIIVFNQFVVGQQVDQHFSPLINMTFPEIMTYLNYPYETHYITTEDGYILTYFRIQAKNSQIKSGLPVIYFQHGLEDSSDTCILNEEDLAPGLLMANAGYDMWFGNSRGNRYSKNHTKYSTSDKKFWQFTFQHMGIYDVPAAFEYIAQETKQKINYIGHSQGTIQMFIALSRNDLKVKKNLKSYIALGPVAWVGNLKSKFMIELANNFFVIDTIIASGANQFLPYRDDSFLPKLCSYIHAICGIEIKEIMDMDLSYDNMKRSDIFIGHIPAGTSTLNLRHWGQNTRDKQFNYFDYGKLMNIFHYGSIKPPRVTVEKIDVPVHLFVGQTDELADVEDVEILRQNLVKSPNVTYNLYPFGHASFLIGNNMTYMNDVFAVLDFYNPKSEEKLQY